MSGGQPKLETLSRYPEIVGLMAEARLQGTEVTPAAADRSGGVTTAITEELRVGTSICERRLRTRSRATTARRLETNGIAIRQRLDGRCVKTTVLTSPFRRAIGAAAR